MRTLVVGDIHLKEYIAEEIIEKESPDRVIFMGDYFDDFFDTPQLNELTAMWLKKSLVRPNRVHLMGNHDFHYLPSKSKHQRRVFCSGYSHAKNEAINKILTHEDWSRLKYLHIEQGWWLSHAGVTRYWFEHPVTGITCDHTQQLIERELERYTAGEFPSNLFATCKYRGGNDPVGGLLFCDWRNLDIIPGVNQIVGHTPHDEIQHKQSEHAENYCVDALPHYMIIEESKINIKYYYQETK